MTEVFAKKLLLFGNFSRYFMEFTSKKSHRTCRRLSGVSGFLGEGVSCPVSGEAFHKGGQQRQITHYYHYYPKTTVSAPILVFLPKFLFVFLYSFLAGPDCLYRGFCGIIPLAKFCSTRGGESVPCAHKAPKIYHIGGIHNAYAHGFPLVRRGQ